MLNERWVLCLRSIPRLYLMDPRGGAIPGYVFHGKKWTDTPSLAVRYVSQEVAELAGRFLLPLVPTVAEHVS